MLQSHVGTEEQWQQIDGSDDGDKDVEQPDNEVKYLWNNYNTPSLKSSHRIIYY